MTTIHGRIEYRSLTLGTLTGDETFRIESLQEGGKRLEAICQLLDREIERRVELEVDPSLAPLRAAVWTRTGASAPQHARYRFDSERIVVELLDEQGGAQDSSTAEDLWARTTLPLSSRLDAFSSRTLVTDGWQTASHPGVAGPEAHSYMMASASSEEDGTGDLETVVLPKTLEYCGEVELEGPVAGVDSALHYRILCSRPDWPPIDILVRTLDRLTLRASWPAVDGYYELVEYEEKTPSHADGQGLPIQEARG